MAKLTILKEGDETLRKKSRPVDEITPRIKTLVKDMIETMHANNGCGLAAPQVGVLRRIVVVECEEGQIYVLINPRIIAYSGEQCEDEGCLSIPGVFDKTRRPMYVTVEGLDIDGNEYTATGEGLLARAFCHELDHLDGILFTDRLADKETV